MMKQSRLLLFLAKYKTSILTLLIFIAYAGAVFWSNYQALTAANENALRQFQAESERHAHTLSYFFSERRNDVNELAESTPIVDFFQNRDLGMSYRYGLSVNIQLIEDRFNYLTTRLPGDTRRVFVGFMLVDRNGEVLASWQTPPGEENAADGLQSESRETGTHLDIKDGLLRIASPIWINERYRGEILAWVDPESSFTQFGPTRNSHHGILIDRQSGQPLRSGSAPPLTAVDWQAVHAALTAADGGNTFEGKGDNLRYQVTRFDVDHTPLALVSYSPSRNLESSTARLFVIAAAMLPFIVVLVGFLDMLERRRLENLRLRAQNEAERLAQARSDFLANMSHEIRTPMNAIIGMTELCLGTRPSRKQRSYLNKIQQTSDLLLRIINDILDFSRIESGRLEIDQSPFYLDRALADAGNLLADEAAKKGIEIIFDLDAASHQRFIGDSFRLEQVLINLIGNAIKFSERGNVTVKARCSPGPDTVVDLHMDVSDEGIGISTEQQTHLFKPFSQADATTTRRFGGSGLGLAICKRLVELMGGTIRVTSTPGWGSTFSFSIRLSVDVQQAPRFTLLTEKRERLRNRPVLVIDDNPAYRSTLAAQLDQIGLACIACASGVEAIATVAQPGREDFLAIFVDQIMPGMNGLETITGLRNVWHTGAVPPIFLLTAHTQDIDQQADTGLFDGMLTKPTTAHQLYSEIAPILGIRIAESATTAHAPESGATLLGREVLLVDDVLFNQEIVRDMLQAAGLSVRVAGNGAEALAAIFKKRPDWVLMDCQMPIMDGYEATRRLRQDGRYRSLPIIALTANALPSEREKCLEAGMNGHIAKPIRSTDLLTVLAAHLEQPSDLPAQPEPATVPDAEASAVVSPLLLKAPVEMPTELPEVPGIDIATGMYYADGRLTNYREILRLFHETHGHRFAVDVGSALSVANWRDASRRAHSFKSAARTIGAERLGELSGKLESACDKQENETAHSILEELNTELQRVCKGLTLLLQHE